MIWNRRGPGISVLGLAALAVLPGCLSPAPEPLDPVEIAAEVESRGIERGVEASADLDPELPLWGEAFLTVQSARGRDAFHRCALAFNPRIREARRRVLMRRALLDGEGYSEPAMGSAEIMRMPDRKLAIESALTLDVLGLFGVQRAAAARAMADAELREALGGFEEAVWGTLVELERDLNLLQIEQRAVGELDELLAAASADGRRTALLAERGWLSDVQSASAAAVLAGVESERSMAAARVSDLRGMIAGTLGLPRWPEEFPPPGGSPGAGALLDVPVAPRDLLATHPRLRLLHLEHGVAEARLAMAAAETWPMLRFGPSVEVVDRMLAGGPMIDLELPDARASQARVRAALLARAQAKEAVEDALAALLAGIERDRSELSDIADLERRQIPVLDKKTRASFAASRALFLSEPEMIERWAMELERRGMAIAAIAQQRRMAASAAAALAGSIGPVLFLRAAEGEGVR